MAERAFDALNDGDYQGWSADWSDAMKSAIGEDAFQSFRKQLMAQYGRFVSVQSVEQRPGEQEGFIRYAFELEFERGTVPFAFGFREDGEQIEGAFLLEE